MYNHERGEVSLLWQMYHVRIKTQHKVKLNIEQYNVLKYKRSLWNVDYIQFNFTSCVSWLSKYPMLDISTFKVRTSEHMLGLEIDKSTLELYGSLYL